MLRQQAAEGPLVADLGFFETTFLTMQRKIFEDQALMHEAYLESGLDAIRALHDAGIIDGGTALAWEQIDSGERDAVRAGNRAGSRGAGTGPAAAARVSRPDTRSPGRW